MKIAKLSIDKSKTEPEGIEPINLERLGAVVALIGRNGSGKSRILRLLEKQLPTIDAMSFVEGNYSNPPMIISAELKKIEAVHDKMPLHREFHEINKKAQLNPAALNLSPDRIQLKNMHAKYNTVFSDRSLRQNARDYQANINAINIKLQQNLSKYFKRIEYSEIHQLQQAIGDASSDSPVTFEMLVETISEQGDYNEFKSIHRTALNYLSKLPHQLVDDYDDCYGDEMKFKERISFKRFSSLKTLVKTFLNKDLEWKKETVNTKLNTEGVTRHSKGVWKIQNRNFNYAEFSDGEKTLFAYSLLFFLLEQNPSIRIKESIVIIDEPELHLHPESELAIIRGIKKVIAEKGQLWIATHSLSILSDLDYDEIFMVKSNSIVSPGKATPGKTFVELMGLDSHIEKLSQFIVNISNWAFLNFMMQCFNEPDVIQSARPNDPEVDLFKKSIKTKSNGVVLLDFGAGKGRIYKEFNTDDLRDQKFQYHALEIEEEHRNALRKLGIKDIYNDYSELPTSAFDFIVLCNVLHEIPIIEWNVILNKIVGSLKSDGFIIIIEDLRLPKGERIGEEGFLILDLSSLKELFALSENPTQLQSTEKVFEDRILCALINRDKINLVDDSTITRALKVLQSNTLSKIKEIRKRPITQETKLALGRESAFHSQLYINTILAIERLN